MSLEENRKRIDDALSFLTIKKLVTPVTKTPAFKLGLVDNDGRIIRKSETDEEKGSLTLFDKFIFKLRRLLGGKISQLNNFLYVQTLDNNFYNNLIVRGAIEQRASIMRVTKDINKLVEKHNISIDDLLVCLLHEEITKNEKGKMMPSVAIKNFSDKSGKSKEEVGRLYQKAKGLVTDQYPKVKTDSEDFYKLVMGILKNMLKLQDEETTVASVGVNPGGDGSHQTKMFSLSRQEVDDENRKRKKVLNYIKNYK